MKYFKIENDNIVDQNGVIVWASISSSNFVPFEAPGELPTRDEAASQALGFKIDNQLSVEKVLQLIDGGLTHEQIIEMREAGVI